MTAVPTPRLSPQALVATHLASAPCCSPPRRPGRSWCSAQVSRERGSAFSIGGWQATHLVGLGYDAAAAARWPATFWIGFTIGRMAATPLAARVSVVTLSLGAIVAATVALATTLVGAAVVPPIIGSVAGRFGTSAIPPSLLVVAGVCALALLRARITAPPISRPPTASRQRGGRYASPSGGH